MATKTDLSRITLEIPKIYHKQLKVLAAELGLTVREFVLDAIKERLSITTITNLETLKAIKNIESRKGLKELESPEDLLKLI